MKSTILGYLLILFCFISINGFTSCSEEESVANGDLKLEGNSIKVNVGETTFLKILSGAGEFDSSSSNREIARTTIEDNRVKILGVSAGNATITIKDKKNQQSTISVVVDYMNSEK